MHMEKMLEPLVTYGFTPDMPESLVNRRGSFHLPVDINYVRHIRQLRISFNFSGTRRLIRRYMGSGTRIQVGMYPARRRADAMRDTEDLQQQGKVTWKWRNSSW